jgi:hypothetical protein
VAQVIRRALVAAAATLSILVFSVDGVWAQSPSPTYYMFDSHAGGSFPPNAPYTSGIPGAIVIEGLGSAVNCNGLHYSQSQIETSAVSWMNAAYNVVIEITPQSYCGTVAQYESEFSGIESYVEAHASNAGYYWGGFMLDEEPGYGFSVASIEAMNAYVSNLMGGTPGMSWWFTENQPTNWSGGLASYNGVIAGSWPAPQAYNDNFVAAINGECTTYGVCVNLVTIESQFSYPWNDHWVTVPKVSGTPWRTNYWASAYYWFNEFRGA